MDNLFDFEDVLILEDVFVDTLSELNIYIEESLALYLDVDIHGYEKHTYYHEFRLIDWQNINSSNFTMLDKIELSSYGFIDDEEYNEESWLVTEGETATFSIESTIVEPFTKEIAFVYLINGEPSEIDKISMFHQLYIELDIHGCKKNALFWESSAYISYLMYKNKNYVGSFMHLFIAFEGVLRFLTGDTDTFELEKVYKSYTGKKFSSQIKKYKKLRNTIMHGNEGQGLEIDEEVLSQLLEEIKELYFMKSV
ncbi:MULTISPECIES: hypothetical protein [Lysinibacillus]|uniref:Apea-like HEPN domain-containing protein n=1 Tax=Lysinibacillus xylanilyticus TaxID=582475 RepID=A0ABV3W514_9BACI